MGNENPVAGVLVLLLGPAILAGLYFGGWPAGVGAAAVMVVLIGWAAR